MPLCETGSRLHEKWCQTFNEMGEALGNCKFASVRKWNAAVSRTDSAFTKQKAAADEFEEHRKSCPICSQERDD